MGGDPLNLHSSPSELVVCLFCYAWFSQLIACFTHLCFHSLPPFIAFLQAFNWESHKKNWYRDCMGKVADWAKQGFTSIWLPPPSDSVSPQVRMCWSLRH